MFVLALVASVWAGSLRPCATPDLRPWSHEFGLGPSVERRSFAGDTLSERDAFSASNVATSSHFALRWGGSESVDSTHVEAMLASLEQAWEVQIEWMGHPLPYGMEDHLFNVYLADTGVEGPWGPLGDFGAAGWFYPDDGEGYPFVVLALDTLRDVDAGGLTAAHEFYHAIQSATGLFREEGVWIWEASATWIEAEVFPSRTEYARFLYGYALLPELPIDHYVSFDSGSLEQYHSYGAFIFPRMLTEHIADWTLIRDLWTEPSEEGANPMDVIEHALETKGFTLWEVFGEFAWRNVGWDYADGEAYAAELLDVPVELLAQGNRFAEVHTGGGSHGWDRVPSDLWPASMGTNLLRWEEPRGDEAFVRIRADRIEAFQATVVVEEGDAFEVLRVDHRDDELDLSFPLSGNEDALTLVVATLDRQSAPGERFEYDYVFGNEAPSADDFSDSGFVDGQACGCSSPSREFFPTGFLFVLLSVLRVRRP